MAKNLVIVESPAKARTISRFLGKDYQVLASMGHIRDLPKSKMSIDVEHDFKPDYIIPNEKKKVVKALKDGLKGANNLWLATDEDREGEAIGWHLLQALKVDPKKMPVRRIVFHEITESAIKDSLKHPRGVDMNVVDAQQARRVLDRLVGYELSPLLWKKIQYGLSAGRVQSVAVRLIVEREREIEAFKPEEYWQIVGNFRKDDKKMAREKAAFSAELKKKAGKNWGVDNEKDAKAVLKDLQGADYTVLDVEKKQTKRSPAPPFITSTLQQEASRKLGFSVKKTMIVAQQLYEGINLGKGETGLITYMRTDSVNLSELALKAANELIRREYGEKYLLDKPRRYKVSKGAQEAHEAIRPVDIALKPEMVAKFLDRDQMKLYELVWKRTVACQMQEAILDKTTVDVMAGRGGKDLGYVFRANGQVINFPGFMEVYMEGRDHPDEEAGDAEAILPPLEKGEKVLLDDLLDTQHFTKPPARYTEASLVKKLESEGIGRPSTYAPTISTIMTRGYVEKDGKALKPTNLAMLVTDLLVEHFGNIVDYKFTAEMEEKLDDVEEGKRKWVPMIREFYTDFHKNVEKNDSQLSRAEVMKDRILGKDKKSGLDVVVKQGRFGAYVQLGEFTKEEIEAMAEKPRRASLPKGIYAESVTMEEALKYLEMPRNLGRNKKGEEVIVNIGRFGPYVKVGAANVSLPKDKNPYSVTLAEVETFAEEAAKLRKKMMEPIKTFGEISVREGRFGPYVSDGTTNASLPKSIDPKDVTLEKAKELLEKKRKSPKKFFGKRK